MAEHAQFYAIALYDYEPQEPDQLALVPGELLAIVDASALAETAWLGAINLDSGIYGWASLNYLHRIDSVEDANAYVQSRPASEAKNRLGERYVPDTLDSLTAKLLAASIAPDDEQLYPTEKYPEDEQLPQQVDDRPYPSHNAADENDEDEDYGEGARSIMDAHIDVRDQDDVDRRSLASFNSAQTGATSGSRYTVYPPSLKSVSDFSVGAGFIGGSGGYEQALRRQRLNRTESLLSADGASNSGSGSSGSTIKSSYPPSSLRTAGSSSSIYNYGAGGESTDSFDYAQPSSLRSERAGYHQPSQSLSSLNTRPTQPSSQAQSQWGDSERDREPAQRAPILAHTLAHAHSSSPLYRALPAEPVTNRGTHHNFSPMPTSLLPTSILSGYTGPGSTSAALSSLPGAPGPVSAFSSSGAGPSSSRAGPSSGYSSNHPFHSKQASAHQLQAHVGGPRERPGLIIPQHSHSQSQPFSQSQYNSSRLTAARSNANFHTTNASAVSPASLANNSNLSTTSPTRSISMTSDSSGSRSSLVSRGTTGSGGSGTGMTTPSSHASQSYLPQSSAGASGSGSGPASASGSVLGSQQPTPTGLNPSVVRRGKEIELSAARGGAGAGRAPGIEELNLWDAPSSQAGPSSGPGFTGDPNYSVSPGGALFYPNAGGAMGVNDVPWYLAPTYHPDELRINSEGVVEAGTLEALVERLTTPRQRVSTVEIEFREAFLTTYRSFTTAHMLMNLLAQRYEMAEPAGLLAEEFEGWKEHKLRPVQMQVLNVLKSWMLDHHLLDAEIEEVPRIREFLSYIKEPERHQKAAEHMLRLMESELGGGSGGMGFMLDGERLPSPLSPSSAVSSGGASMISTRQASSSGTNITTSSSHGSTHTTSSSNSTHSRRKGHGAPFRRRPTKADVLKFSADDLAQQLMLMEYNMYARISSNELITIANSETRDAAGNEVRNVQRFSTFNRKLAKTAKHLVLTTEPVAKRREVLMHLIKVIEKCRNLNNYAAVHFLMVGITSSCLDKLTFTWQGVEKHQRLDGLRLLTRSHDGYAGYRNAFDNVGTGCCIPVIGIYIPGLAAIHKSADTIPFDSPYSSATELINFAKCRAMAEVCRKALRFQGRRPTLSSTTSTSPPPPPTTPAANTPIGSTVGLAGANSTAQSPGIQEIPEIQQWIEEQFDIAGGLPDQWFNTKAAEVLKREEDHSDIRYKKGLEAAGF